MSKNKRIIRFITYYRLQTVKHRGKLRELISEACEFKGGTFDYKILNKNYSELELSAIEQIITNHKDGKIEVL
ncbi:MAG: hypothetical protein ACOYM7_10715 [Paludibacter sp.]